MKLVRIQDVQTDSQHLRIEVWQCPNPECGCLQVTVYDMLQPYRKGSSAMGLVIEHMEITAKE